MGVRSISANPELILQVGKHRHVFMPLSVSYWCLFLSWLFSESLRNGMPGAMSGPPPGPWFPITSSHKGHGVPEWQTDPDRGRESPGSLFSRR